MQSVVFIISVVNGVLQLIALVLSFSCLQPFLNQKRAGTPLFSDEGTFGEFGSVKCITNRFKKQF